ncbi:hypothetical protein DFH29DRAFT_1006536 [Suillus ampliporus]|nr:hypothetical protein DFH29DRAFT_1006536 [Suillus ampliporus]
MDAEDVQGAGMDVDKDKDGAGMDGDKDGDSDSVGGAEGNNDDNDNGVVEGPVANCDVKLACTIECKCAHTILDLGKEPHLPELPTLLRYFLYDQLYADDNHTSADVPLL